MSTVVCLTSAGGSGGYIRDCQQAWARCDPSDLINLGVLMNNGPSGSYPGTPLELGIARLRSAGKRITQARMALIGLLLKQAKPLSMEEIQEELEGISSCDLVTVYRCLLAFGGLGMVRREYDFEGTTLWQYVRKTTPAYRVISKVTADSEALDSELYEVLGRAFEGVEKVLKERRYLEISHRAQFSPRVARDVSAQGAVSRPPA